MSQTELQIEYRSCPDKKLASYLAHVTEEGVAVRRVVPCTQLKAMPHASAVEHLAEMRTKLWKDFKFGGTLWCSDDSEPFLGNLQESALGKVPKMNPDRTISKERRPIHDMREPNKGGSRFNHPQLCNLVTAR